MAEHGEQVDAARKYPRRKFLLEAGALGTAAGLAGAFSGIGASISSASTVPGTAMSKPRRGNGKYVEISALNSLPYFYDHQLGTEYAGKWLGVPTQFLGPATYDLNAMISVMESAIAENVSGMAVVGFDPSLAPAINKAVAAGIPVVTVDGDVPNSKRLAFVGTDNVYAGNLGGKELAKLLHGRGKVAIVTKVGQDNLNLRVEGYKQALSAAGIKVVAVLNDNSDPTTAASVVSAELERTPDLAGIACVEAAGGEGAATAVKEAHKAGKVKIVSMDRDAATLQAITEGLIQVSVAQKTALMPFYAFVMCQLQNTLTIPITTNNTAAGVSELCPNVATGNELITRDNVKYWTRSGT